MERMKARKSPTRRAKIETLQAQMTREEGGVAAHILDCIVRGSYFDADEMKETHPQALELAYLHLGDDKEEASR
ncbi:hypothetical protein [Agrobacterium sp. NPDC089420]|uniref:hypothetical protein n=1 Tax=Agrobacterium sp. NPDC089420 TaxID=3363918 RepID=UPI00384DAFD0